MEKIDTTNDTRLDTLIETLEKKWSHEDKSTKYGTGNHTRKGSNIDKGHEPGNIWKTIGDMAG